MDRLIDDLLKKGLGNFIDRSRVPLFGMMRFTRNAAGRRIRQKRSSWGLG